MFQISQQMRKRKKKRKRESDSHCTSHSLLLVFHFVSSSSSFLVYLPIFSHSFVSLLTVQLTLVAEIIRPGIYIYTYKVSLNGLMILCSIECFIASKERRKKEKGIVSLSIVNYQYSLFVSVSAFSLVLFLVPCCWSLCFILLYASRTS